MDSATTAARKAIWTYHEIVADSERILEDSGGECTPDYSALEALATDTAEFALEQIKLARTELKAKVQMNKNLAASYGAKSNGYAAQVKRLEEEALVLLHHMDTRKVSTPSGSVWIADGSESTKCPEDEAGLKKLHANYPHLVRVKYEPKKREIAAEIKDGFDVEGCEVVRGPESIRFS